MTGICNDEEPFQCYESLIIATAFRDDSNCFVPLRIPRLYII